MAERPVFGEGGGKMQNLGRQLDRYETRIQRLQTELINATTDKHELVDALRSLHGQLYSLQMDADKQCDVLLSGGEKLRATKQCLASLQQEIASTRQEYERSQVNNSKQDIAANKYVSGDAEADYSDALRGKEQEIRAHKAAAARQAKDNAELRRHLDNRSRRIKRLNRYIIRMRRELTILNDEIRTAKTSISPRNGRLAAADKEIAALAKPQEKPKTRSVSTVTQLRPATRRKQEPQWRAGDYGQEAFGDIFIPQQFVIVPSGDDVQGTQYPLNKNELTIGRNQNHDIPVRERNVSRVHARIILRGFKVFIEDLGSKYGLLVNSEPRERHELKHGDRFTIGHKEFELVDLAIRASGLRTTPAA